MKIKLPGEETSEPTVTFRLSRQGEEIVLVADISGDSKISGTFFRIARIFVKDGKVIMKRSCDLPEHLFHTSSINHYISLEPSQ